MSALSCSTPCLCNLTTTSRCISWLVKSHKKQVCICISRNAVSITAICAAVFIGMDVANELFLTCEVQSCRAAKIVFCKRWSHHVKAIVRSNVLVGVYDVLSSQLRGRNGNWFRNTFLKYVEFNLCLDPQSKKCLFLWNVSVSANIARLLQNQNHRSQSCSISVCDGDQLTMSLLLLRCFNPFIIVT